MPAEAGRATAWELDLLFSLRLAGSRPPLFCLPPASGSPAGYQGLAAALQDDRPVYGLACPGFDGGRPPLTSVQEMADEYASVLLRLGAGHPYHLLGWSMGAVVAFETARRLTAGQRKVGALVLVDPSPTAPGPLPAEPDIARRFLADLLGDADGDVVVKPADSAAAPADAASLFEAARDHGLIPEELDLEFMLERYTVFRANVQAMAGYLPSGRYSGIVTLVSADRGPDTTQEWKALTERVREHRLRADHYSIIYGGEALPALAAVVDTCLEDAT